MDSEKSPDKKEKKLVERLHEAIRVRNYSRRTEQSYWYWIRYFIHFHGERHPAEMGAPEVTGFLTWLATERDVAAATQNQALSAGEAKSRQVPRRPRVPASSGGKGRGGHKL